jgi:2-keto-4-pentenoate hydratase
MAFFASACRLAPSRKLTSEHIQEYMKHLFPAPGVNIMPIHEVLPGPQDTIDDAYRHQQLVCAELKRMSGAPRAWRVVGPQDPLIRHFSVDQPIVAPVVRGWKYDNTAHFRLKERQLHTVEAALVVYTAADGSIAAVAPSASVSSSRFPFYAPHAPGFAADLASFGAIVVGKRTDVADLPADWQRMGLVITRDDTPRAVGYIDRSVGGSPKAATDVALSHVASWHGQDAPVSVVTTGTLATLPVAVGNFKINFGPLGSVDVSFE